LGVGPGVRLTPIPLRHLPAKPLDNNQAAHEFIDKVSDRMRDVLISSTISLSDQLERIPGKHTISLSDQLERIHGKQTRQRKTGDSKTTLNNKKSLA